MTSVGDGLSAIHGGRGKHRSNRRAMGAQERRRWSSFVRQDLIATTAATLRDSQTYGVVVLGPSGVGKSTLARSIAETVSDTTYVVRLYGTGLETSVPYSVWGLQMAQMDTREAESPIAVIQGIADVVAREAGGRDVLLMVDDLANIDTPSMGVAMHLVFSGAAKLLVLARSLNEMPEDFAWLLKDGRLSKVSLANFTRSEVQTLITMALGGSVAASAVTALHASSGGNPLVLHTLVHEEISRGHLVQQNSTWVLNRELAGEPAQLLVELVESRLGRETPDVRRAVEKMALIQRAPLSMVIEVLGAEMVNELEQRHYLHISNKVRNYTALAEPHIGETVRAMLGRAEKAQLFQEMKQVVTIAPEHLSRQELLVFAAWAQEAGIALEPQVALAAGRAAVLYFDPMLALRCTVAIPRDTAAWVQASLVRCNAYSIMADYPKALGELLEAKNMAARCLDVADHALWVSALAGALMWVDGGAAQIPELLAAARLRVDGEITATQQQLKARRCLNLAMFEYQVHCGFFAEAVGGLEEGRLDASDVSYRLNCGSLLVMAWAVTGRELDAIDLARQIGDELATTRTILRQPELYVHGLVLALTWTGQWHESARLLTDLLDTMQRSSEFRGGIMELGLGIAYTYAGKGQEAADILLVAVAQLEIRDTYNATQLAYSALAFAFAQVDSREESSQYLALARALHPNTAWVNLAMSTFFMFMAERWMDDPEAPGNLVASAMEDVAAGRYTTASMSLFGATMNGQEKQFDLLADIAARRQGPMAELSVALASACRDGNAEQALVAAGIAESLDLAAVESRCAVVALDLAREAGDARRARAAEARLERLMRTLPVLPLMPQTEGVKMTARELQIAKLAGRGMGNRAIADRIGVSVRTVEGHLYQVFAKLGISSRNELP